MEERLKSIIYYANSNCSFYRVAYRKQIENIDIEALPIVTKQELLNNRHELISQKYFKNPENLLYEYTSGTTGLCMEIAWRKEDMNRSMLPLWLYRKKYYGILPSDRFCYFYTYRNSGQKEKMIEYGKNEIGFSKVNLSDERLIQIYEEIIRFDPVWLLLQPSIAIPLSQMIFQEGFEVPPSLKYVELTGEMCTENQKRFIAAAFGCEVSRQYGTYEVNSIAYECPCGNLHLMTQNVFTEICKNGKRISDGEVGNIVVTSLHNKIMPFIRYDTGDLGRIIKKECSCGNQGEIIELVGCRDNDIVACDDGGRISAYEFVRIFQCINNYTDLEVYQYQIVQVEYRKFIVKIVSGAEIDCLKSAFMDNILNEYLKNSKYEFHITQKVCYPAKGEKHKFFTCMVMTEV